MFGKVQGAPPPPQPAMARRRRLPSWCHPSFLPSRRLVSSRFFSVPQRPNDASFAVNRSPPGTDACRRRRRRRCRRIASSSCLASVGPRGLRRSVRLPPDGRTNRRGDKKRRRRQRRQRWTEKRGKEGRINSPPFSLFPLSVARIKELARNGEQMGTPASGASSANGQLGWENLP